MNPSHIDRRLSSNFWRDNAPNTHAATRKIWRFFQHLEAAEHALKEIETIDRAKLEKPEYFDELWETFMPWFLDLLIERVKEIEAQKQD
jgi:hypothetical protein